VTNYLSNFFLGKIDPSWARQLNESASNRYSLVCNAIIAVSNETNNDKLNDIALTCAELTACCNALPAEWLGKCLIKVIFHNLGTFLNDFSTSSC